MEAFQQRFSDLLAGRYNPTLGTELFDRIFPGGVLDAGGNCPDDEPPPPPGEPIDTGDDEAGPAQPIVAAPSFTG